LKLYVGNLSSDVSESQLSDLVLPYGKPSSTEIVKDRATGDSRGFAFIELSSDAEGRAAIAGLDGKEVSGRAIKVNEARPRTGRA